MKQYLFVLFFFLSLSSCHNSGTAIAEKIGFCDKDCKKNGMYCKLTTTELRERKATVIANLKKQIVETKELNNGFSYKFAGTDSVIDELTTFVKTERQCCSFFEFNITVKDSAAILTLTGPKGAKEFIKTELEF